MNLQYIENNPQPLIKRLNSFIKNSLLYGIPLLPTDTNILVCTSPNFELYDADKDRLYKLTTSAISFNTPEINWSVWHTIYASFIKDDKFIVIGILNNVVNSILNNKRTKDIV